MVAGGGERNGMEGITVGIEGMFGNEPAGSGGRVTCGTDGMVGMLGSGGRVGRVVGIEGCARVGIVGNGGTFP